MKHIALILTAIVAAALSANVYGQDTSVKNLTNKDFTISKEIGAWKENGELSLAKDGCFYTIQNTTYGSAGNVVKISMTYDGETATFKTLKDVYVVSMKMDNSMAYIVLDEDFIHFELIVTSHKACAVCDTQDDPKGYANVLQAAGIY